MYLGLKSALGEPYPGMQNCYETVVLVYRFLKHTHATEKNISRT